MMRRGRSPRRPSPCRKPCDPSRSPGLAALPATGRQALLRWRPPIAKGRREALRGTGSRRHPGPPAGWLWRGWAGRPVVSAADCPGIGAPPAPVLAAGVPRCPSSLPSASRARARGHQRVAGGPHGCMVAAVVLLLAARWLGPPDGSTGGGVRRWPLCGGRLARKLPSQERRVDARRFTGHHGLGWHCLWTRQRPRFR